MSLEDSYLAPPLKSSAEFAAEVDELNRTIKWQRALFVFLLLATAGFFKHQDLWFEYKEEMDRPCDPDLYQKLFQIQMTAAHLGVENMQQFYGDFIENGDASVVFSEGGLTDQGLIDAARTATISCPGETAYWRVLNTFGIAPVAVTHKFGYSLFPRALETANVCEVADTVAHELAHFSTGEPHPLIHNWTTDIPQNFGATVGAYCEVSSLSNKDGVSSLALP